MVGPGGCWVSPSRRVGVRQHRWICVVRDHEEQPRVRRLFASNKKDVIPTLATVTGKSTKPKRGDEATICCLSYEYGVGSKHTETIQETPVDSNIWNRVQVGDTLDILVLAKHPRKHILQTKLIQLQSVAAIWRPYSIICGVLNLWRLQQFRWSLGAYFTSSWISVKLFLACMFVNATLMCLGVAILCLWGGVAILAELLQPVFAGLIIRTTAFQHHQIGQDVGGQNVDNRPTRDRKLASANIIVQIV